MAGSLKRKKSDKEIETRFGETAGRFMAEIRRRMERRRICGAEVARRMGISRAAVNRFLMPGTNPTLRTMVSIAAVLDVEIEMVFHRTRPLSILPRGLKLKS